MRGGVQAFLHSVFPASHAGITPARAGTSPLVMRRHGHVGTVERHRDQSCSGSTGGTTSAEMDRQTLLGLPRHPRRPIASTVAPSLLDANGLPRSPCRAPIPSTPLRGGDILPGYSQLLTPRRALSPRTTTNASRTKRFPPNADGRSWSRRLGSGRSGFAAHSLVW
jgi:hypothetical protein